MEPLDNRDVFADKGIKNTRQRNLVLDVLKDCDVPLTAEQVFVRAREADGLINLSTVYRILDTFVSKGVALKADITDDSKSMFELNRKEHKHHLICLSCKKVISIAGDCPIHILEKSLEGKTDFDITGHKLEIFGYCPKCKAQNNK